MNRAAGTISNGRRGGFTLIELLLVIGIIAILISLVLPVAKRARAQAQLIVCKSNMTQIYQAMLLYGNDNRDNWPHGDLLGSYGFRMAPGLRYPGQTTGRVETYGLPSLLHGIQPGDALGDTLPKPRYLDGRSKIWQCPSYRDDLLVYGNTYSFTAPSGTGGSPPANMRSYNSIERAKSPKSAFVWDNVTQVPGRPGFPGPFTGSGWTYDSRTRPYPHPYTKSKNSTAVYLYVDGHIDVNEN